MTVNAFDTAILSAINSISRQSMLFDAAMHGFANNYLLKSASLIALIYWAWFAPQDEEKTRWRREQLLCGLAAAVATSLAVRIVSFLLPFRARPMHEEDLNFVLPYFMRPEVNTDWSSFPSDTAALIVPLALGLWQTDRRLGIAAFAIVVLACFARMYSGLHYPTDILVSSGMGIVMYYAIAATRLRQLVIRPAMYVFNRYPGLFYAGFFLLTYQIANVFWESFNIVNHVSRALFSNP